MDALIAHGFLTEEPDGGSTDGRPPRRLRLRTREHSVAGVDLGASHCWVALLEHALSPRQVDRVLAGAVR